MIERSYFVGKKDQDGKVSLLLKRDSLEGLAPLLETDKGWLEQNPPAMVLFSADLERRNAEYELSKIWMWLNEVYGNWKHWGPFGDVIQVTKVPSGNGNFFYYADFFRMAYHKPALAADLLVFFSGNNGKKYFVGIIRGKEPGKGKPALIGGFQEVRGMHLQTPQECLLQEGREEAGIRFKPMDEVAPNGCLVVKGMQFEQMTETGSAMKHPMRKSVSIKICYGGTDQWVEMRLLGTFPTSKEEELANLGVKRVNWTTAYYVDIPTQEELSEEKLQGWLTAGDDAAEIFIHDISRPEPEFGIRHHQGIYRAAMNVLKGGSE